MGFWLAILGKFRASGPGFRASRFGLREYGSLTLNPKP